MLKAPVLAPPARRDHAGSGAGVGAVQSIAWFVFPSEGADQSFVNWVVPSEGADQSVLLNPFVVSEGADQSTFGLFFPSEGADQSWVPGFSWFPSEGASA